MIGILIATVVIAFAAAKSISIVIRSIRYQEKEMALIDGPELAPGGFDRPK